MKKLLKIVLVSSMTLLFFSCYYDEFPEEVIIEIPIDQVISFSSDIAPIFVSYDCSQCHNASGTSPNLSPGSEYTALVPSYVKAGNSADSKLYTILAFENHRNLDAESLALIIKKWIDDGAENN